MRLEANRRQHKRSWIMQRGARTEQLTAAQAQIDAATAQIDAATAQIAAAQAKPTSSRRRLAVHAPLAA
jgi:hypothetical protein